MIGARCGRWPWSLLAANAASAQEALRTYEIVGDAIPASLTGKPGDRGARPRHRGQAARAFACCATPARSRRSASRATWRPT